MYVSEFTHFLEDLKQKNPKIVADQRKGRAIWWDKKPQSFEDIEHSAKSKVRQTATSTRRRSDERCAKRPPPGDDAAVARDDARRIAASRVDRQHAGTTDGLALARLYGEPLFAVPQDLYIPPDALEVFLEAFEGPLDLLLYLIRKQNFNVLDIPMAEVTRQYLGYIEQIRKSNLELAGEYLLMAAMLIEIKSRMLLPVRKQDGKREVDDPRAELVRRLVEYERMKLAAQQVDALPVIGRDFVTAAAHIDETVEQIWPDVHVADLQAAWCDVLRRASWSSTTASRARSCRCANT